MRRQSRVPVVCTRFRGLFRLPCFVAAVALPIASTAAAQLCQTTHTTDLYCLLPSAFHTQSLPFNAFFTPFGTELGELPTPAPAGLVLSFRNGVLQPSSESLGSIFSERAETIGKRRLFLGFTYQNFGFGSLDGVRLKQLPILLYYPPLQVYTATESRINVRAGQYAAEGAIGLTRTVDLSVAIPFERVAFSASVQGEEYGPGGATAQFTEYVPGSSSGIGDVTVSAKDELLDWKALRLAAGLAFRLPTGDELNFLGSGTPGVRPYVAFSSRPILHRLPIAPHSNVGYQWNGHSILNTNAAGGKKQLPPNVLYTAGFDVAVGRRVSFVADLLGQHFLNAPRFTGVQNVPIPFATVSAPTVGTTVHGFTSDNLALGFKADTLRHLVVTANATIKLDNGGLRARIVPLGAVSYSF